MEPENGLIRPYYPALAVLWRLVDAVIIILAYSAGWLAVGNAWPPDHLIVADNHGAHERVRTRQAVRLCRQRQCLFHPVRIRSGLCASGHG